MDDVTVLNPVPIRNIIKSNLVQHANKILGHLAIDELSNEITEAIELFLNAHLKNIGCFINNNFKSRRSCHKKD